LILGAIFVSNIYFWQATDYFAGEAETGRAGDDFS